MHYGFSRFEMDQNSGGQNLHKLAKCGRSILSASDLKTSFTFRGTAVTGQGAIESSRALSQLAPQ